MAATNSGRGTGHKNYYSVSFGKLSSRQKTPPEDYTEINETELKKQADAIEQLDLRKKYLMKTGDFPYKCFYDSITGTIIGFERRENDNGISLDLSLSDSDGDNSIVQTKFYSKYTENLLNRLINTTPNSELTFTPYSIPGTFDLDGKPKEYYNQGVSVKNGGNKIEQKYDAKNEELPPTEQIQNSQGKVETSRVKRVNWLFAKFSEMYKDLSAPAQQKADESKSFMPEADHSDLPF